MMPAPTGAHSHLPSGLRIVFCSGNGRCGAWVEDRSRRDKASLPGKVAELPGSQLSMKFGSGIALRVAAASLPVPVLHAISFSSSRIRLCFGAAARGLAQLVVDGLAIGLYIFESPEIEAANAIGMKGFAEFDAAVEHRVLLLEVEVGVELVAARALL